MPHSYGFRARTRDMFSKGFRKSGMVHLSTYLKEYKVGDYVDIKADPSIHKGMPFKVYHGRTGVIYNVTKRAVGVKVNKIVNGRVIVKKINVRIEHVSPSKCRSEYLNRVKSNEARKAEIKKAGGEKVNLKRTPVLPKGGYVYAASELEHETIQPIPFVDLV